MQENLIQPGDAFFTSAGYDYNNKGHHKPEPPVNPTPQVTPDYECEYWTGDLPAVNLPDGKVTACAPLAVAFVPVQRSAEPAYEPDNALTRGTLFPGLDLPFMDIANKNNPYAGTPLGELMAISFATHELTLYLDTHPRDKSAFMTLKKLLRLKKEATARYTKLYGPVSTDDLLETETFTWTHSPWPWETPAPGSSKPGVNSGRV